MFKTAVDEIRSAEEKATGIRQAAVAEVKKLHSRAELAGEELCKDAEQKAEELYRIKIDDARAEADKIIAESRTEAKIKAAEVTAVAKAKFEEAVQTVLKGVMQDGNS